MPRNLPYHPPDAARVCKQCGKPQPPEEFRASHTPPKFYSKCRACRGVQSHKTGPRGGHERRDTSPWQCLYDPDGDFTGKLLSCEETKAMIEHKSFSPGAVLLSSSGKRVEIYGERSEAIGAAV